MPTALDSRLVAAAKREPMTVAHRGRTVTLTASTARAFMITADLAVVEEGEIIGYITPYSNTEHGAVRARYFLIGGAPEVFRTLEDALDEIFG